jgi:hypothetical protein
MPDQLDAFLGGDFSCEVNETLQNTLRERTAGLVRRRRRLRYLAYAALAAACYLAGLTTTWLLPAHSAVTGNPAAEVAVQVATKTEPVKIEPGPTRPALDKLQAIADPAERAEQLRKAGDLYLERFQDYATALRCYSAALDAGGTVALESSPEDNWLVSAIKRDRRREKMHEE